jgi:iron-sulfur cluster assembly protein
MFNILSGESMAEDLATAEITLTPEAAAEIKRVRTENNIPESLALRLGVKDGNGCCGVSYVLGFDETAGETDHVFQSEGLTVFVDPKSFLRLAGAKLGFIPEPEGRGFYFDNPNEEGFNCGENNCGDGSCGDSGCDCGH